jgi:hypothetical protein
VLTTTALATGALALIAWSAVDVRDRPAVHVPTTGPWAVIVGAGHDDLGPCLDDPAVDYAITPAIMPPGPTSVGLVRDATIEDARRVLDCVTERAGRVPIEVSSPAG